MDEKTNLLASVLSALPQGVIGHDLDRRIFLFSKGAEKLTGMTAAEVLGKDCHEVFHPMFCGQNCLCPGPGAKPCEDPSSYTTVVRAKDGARKNLEVAVVPLRDEAGAFTGMLASLTDRTREEALVKELKEEASFRGIVGQDHRMQAVYGLIRDVAASDAPVVITGESGTGKELVANAIHLESERRDGLFVPVNCGALPAGTLESELFGHVRGAFTGAIRDRSGRFTLADKGTLFLDEVSELPPAVQVKLLRVLQEGTFEPVGAEKTVKVDVRVISATNRDLKSLVQQGLFREDLYYRLAVFPLELPPLRERRTDIPALAAHFLSRIREKEGKPGLRLTDEALDALMAFDWPGNVRQLQNAIRYASIKSRGGAVLPEHLPPELKTTAGKRPGRKLKLDFDAVEKILIQCGGNKARAARKLNVGRATLYHFMRGHPELERIAE